MTDWGDRTLCDDGSCTGVIGGDGLCKVCGKPSQYWGDERRRGQHDVDDDGDGEDDAPADEGPGAFADDDRQLCLDGDCTGLVGEDGHCKVCGLPGPKPRAAMARAAAAGAASKASAAADDDDDDEGDDDDDDDRRLCPDGSCTGLLDARGVCKVCGHSLTEN